MDQLTPEISVVMPVWNGGEYLQAAIDSILGQTERNFEFIIIDDGSTDDTPAILRDYSSQDARVRVITLDHQGIVTALNRGVGEATARWIARMDADDVAYPDRLARQLTAVKSARNSVMCYTRVRQIGAGGDHLPSSFVSDDRARLAMRLCYYNPFFHSTVLFDKEAFLRAGGYHQEERHGEDFGLWGRLIQIGNFVGVDEVLLDFRVHEGSISKVMNATQADVAHHISIRHCAEFFALTSEQAARLQAILAKLPNGNTWREWCWLVVKCTPKLRWQSLELWAWIVWITAVRAFTVNRGTASAACCN